MQGRAARRAGYHWVFVDTPPNTSGIVTDAVHSATLVIIPARLTVFDLAAVKETMDLARQLRKPYAVVINAAPARRQDVESPMVTYARENLLELGIPVWGGQVTQRANFSLALAEGAGAKEYAADSLAANEMARLWIAIEKSVKAINGARDGASMHRAAA